jgi:hypothetical protein
MTIGARMMKNEEKYRKSTIYPAGAVFLSD